MATTEIDSVDSVRQPCHLHKLFDSFVVCHFWALAIQFSSFHRVATHLENLERSEILRGRGKVGENVFLHVVNYREYCSRHRMCKKGVSKVVHKIKSGRRKGLFLHSYPSTCE